LKLAVSNIAWSFEDRIEAYKILQDFGIRGLEIAPTLLFHNAVTNKVDLSDKNKIASIKQLHDFQLQLVSMQSVLYGSEFAKLFDGEESLIVFENTMREAISLAGKLGIGNIVFGSPASRFAPETMTTKEAYQIASKSLLSLGDFAKINNTTISVEATPTVYGSNFIINTNEAINFVLELNHSAIKLNLDLGVLIFQNEMGSIESLIQDNISLIGHVHISEPALGPAPFDVVLTAKVLRALKNASYHNWISIEMKEHHSLPIDKLRLSVNNLIQAVKLVDQNT